MTTEIVVEATTNGTGRTNVPNPQSAICDLQSATVTRAAARLGWTIVGRPAIHPDGTVYFCRDHRGCIETYTEFALLQQLACMTRFFNALLQAAGVPKQLAAHVADHVTLAPPNPTEAPSKVPPKVGQAGLAPQEAQ